MSCLVLDCSVLDDVDWSEWSADIEHMKYEQVKIMGETLSPIYIGMVYNFVSEFKRTFPDKKISIHTKYDIETIKTGTSYLDRRRKSMIENFVDEVLVA